MNRTPEAILSEVFGYSQFRPFQKDIIDNIIAGNNTLAILPTGGGKSLCYQIPAILFDGITIVVSPLISLMQDQIGQLHELGINAAVLNSSIARDEYYNNIYDLKSGNIKLLYMAPETLLQPRIIDLLKDLNISLTIIDEAHCISEWGHEFRPEYRRLVELKEHIPNSIWAAFTATATPRVQNDIIETLGFSQSNKFIASFDRKNLFLDVVPKLHPFDQTLEFIKSFPDQPGIIYCTTRKQVDELCSDLQAENLKVKPYHAGLSDKERIENQNLFIKDDINIIVATVAFGMGINKPDIRFILHYDLPKNIESYYQQIGRAGRDGLQSFCRLLFSYGDINKIKYFINRMSVKQEQEIAETHLNAMVKFAETAICRRQPLITYFGENYSIENCEMCDNCTVSLEEQTDITIAAQKYLSCIARSGQYFGCNHIIDILRGSKAEKIIKLKHDKLSTYNIGGEFSKTQWTLVNNELIKQGFIVRDENGSLKLQKNAWKVFRNEVRVYCAGIEKEKKAMIQSSASDTDYDVILFDKLRQIRKELADAKNIPPFAVLSNKALMDICTKYPMSENSFRNIYGVGSVKAENYAGEFIPVIIEYCEEHGIEEKKVVVSTRKRKNTKDGKGTRAAEVAMTFDETESIEKTASHLNIKELTVIDNLYKHLQNGNPLFHSDALKNYVDLDEETVKAVMFTFEELGCRELRPVWEEFEGDVSYDDLKILRLIFLS